MIPWLAAILISLPTGNEALLRPGPGGDAAFFQPTIEGTVASGMFGCVRREGRKFHEGIDIRCQQRDRRGESIDPVRAVADGEVVFVNSKPGLSNYGRYVVLSHRWDGVEVFTLCAHLREVAVTVDQVLKRGDPVGTLGRSTNTREGIPAERAHLHFEINFMLNPGFRTWYPKRDPKAPPFGNFNGRNLVGLDPAVLFRAYAGNQQMNFAEFVAKQAIAFTVLVNARPFPWLSTHPEQIQPATATPVVYEIGVTAWGMPITLWPRTADEVTGSAARSLQRGLAVVHRVNESELQRNGCRDLVEQSRGGWRLSAEGREWLELLTYRP